MRFPITFKRREAISERAEPIGLRAAVPVMQDEDALVECSNGPDFMHSHPQSFESVFSLLEGRVDLRASSPADAIPEKMPSSSTARVDPDELMQALHVHYCEALESGDGLSAGVWKNVSDAVVRADPSSTRAPEFEADRTPSAGISEMFSEPQRLEEAIGPLTADHMFADPAFEEGTPGNESAPEILQLFAPPEYRANLALRRRAMPPTLARREHHALALDSPLPGFQAAAPSMQNQTNEEAVSR